MIRPINIPSTTYYISNLLLNAQCVKNGIIMRVEIFFKKFTSQSLANLCAEWQQESQRQQQQKWHFFVFFIVDLSPLCLLLNGKDRVSQRLPNVRLTLDGRFIAVSPYRWMALRVSVVVTGFGLGKCCCCGAVLL